ncbi:MAG: GGDEF domain-containing protein [Deltaproteobacteria bacterium]|nr:GGDEF domain-containing protein [Deltaproteobacteria bacterium]
MKINIAEDKIILRVLQRLQWIRSREEGLELNEMLSTILKWANAFVPSESGSILLDDPILTKKNKKPDRLYFLACFGKGSASLAGNVIPANLGIVGQTYKSGKPYISKVVDKDKLFFKGIDKKTKYKTQSIICVPVVMGSTTVGVVELINRAGKINYDEKDLAILKIFAGYTSTLIQNTLDAKRFSELSVKDNLTGLYNDRYFFEALHRLVPTHNNPKKDLSLIFFDLDRFKEVNDTYGHLAGSRVLHEIGIILTSYLEHNESIIPVRYGGDEFILILPDYNIEKARALAEDIRETIEGFTFLAQKTQGFKRALKIKNIITGSFGVASLRENVKKRQKTLVAVPSLIKAADTAMYGAKEKGKNAVVLAKGVFNPN